MHFIFIFATESVFSTMRCHRRLANDKKSILQVCKERGPHTEAAVYFFIFTVLTSINSCYQLISLSSVSFLFDFNDMMVHKFNLQFNRQYLSTITS